MPLLFAGFFHYFFAVLMFFTSLFLILLVLVQRGRGGGLAGAFGGLGGQSAFGAKAGDLFTRITMIAATVWILLCMAAIKMLNSQSSRFGDQPAGSALSAPRETGGSGESEQAPPAAGGGESPAAEDRSGAAPPGGDPGDGR